MITNNEIKKYRPAFYPVVQFILTVIFLFIIYYYTRFLPFFLFGLAIVILVTVINMPSWVLKLSSDKISFEVFPLFTFVHKSWSYQLSDIQSVSFKDVTYQAKNFSIKHRGYIHFLFKDGSTKTHGLGTMIRYRKNRLVEDIGRFVEVSSVDLNDIL